MKSSLAGLVLCALSANAFGYAAGSMPRTVETVRGNSTSYRCDSSPTGSCEFILYTNDCKDTVAANGKPALVCTYQFVEQFSLKVGDKRVIKDQPPLRACTSAPGKPLSFPACVRDARS